MGKAAKLKQLRRLANQLPVIATNQNIHVLIQGRNIHNQKDKAGEEIDPTKVYGGEKNIAVNHYKKMKQNYNKAGMAGAAVYSKSVKEYAKQKNLKPGEDASPVGTLKRPER